MAGWYKLVMHYDLGGDQKDTDEMVSGVSTPLGVGVICSVMEKLCQVSAWLGFLIHCIQVLLL